MSVKKYEAGEALPERPDSQKQAVESMLHALAGWRTHTGHGTLTPVSLAAIPALEHCLRRALAAFFRFRVSAIHDFLADWESYKEVALQYPVGESWDSFRNKGQHLLSIFLLDELPGKISGVQAVWKRYAVTDPGMKSSQEGIIDLVAAVEGVMSVVLFLLSVESPGKLPEEWDCELAAALQAQPKACQAVACVFATWPKPSICWRRLELTANANGRNGYQR